jgi:hypothetical protein
MEWEFWALKSGDRRGASRKEEQGSTMKAQEVQNSEHSEFHSPDLVRAPATGFAVMHRMRDGERWTNVADRYVDVLEEVGPELPAGPLRPGCW